MEHIVNTGQAQAWNGPEGSHWAAYQDRWDAVNDGFNKLLLDAAGLAHNAQVLDIGCGAGRTTRLAARLAPAGRAVGLDLSGPMLDRARATARDEAVANAEFLQGDAQVHPLSPDTFDAAISRYGVMFFADPAAAFANLGRALRPHGRLAFVCPAEPEGNEWITAMTSLRGILPVGDFGTPGAGMFSLSDPDRITGILSAAGFADIRIEHVTAYGHWGEHAEDAAAFLLDSGPGRHLLDQVDADVQAQARSALQDVLRLHETEGRVALRSTAWLVTARRQAATPSGA
ncbi:MULTISPECIES: class I SAM-dependent methyltransferase [Streptomyces]|uniref:SAM-dependent methyltransferase n=1 Tax=Streptomyces venezuelae TaxID=54571 RepID=A0A5P2APF8_STRVZ|nr:class I SAM-dependent methyltransferase [Streptomyces venezuelae]QES18741.1 SAM-dependent methyltransferase [Streptomyces venezuelae]